MRKSTRGWLVGTLLVGVPFGLMEIGSITAAAGDATTTAPTVGAKARSEAAQAAHPGPATPASAAPSTTVGDAHLSVVVNPQTNRVWVVGEDAGTDGVSVVGSAVISSKANDGAANGQGADAKSAAANGAPAASPSAKPSSGPPSSPAAGQPSAAPSVAPASQGQNATTAIQTAVSPPPSPSNPPAASTPPRPDLSNDSVPAVSSSPKSQPTDNASAPADAGHSEYVAGYNPTAQNITVVESKTNKVVATIPAPSALPQGLTPETDKPPVPQPPPNIQAQPNGTTGVETHP